MAEKRHPGITMHKFTIGAGFEGLLFTVGCSLIFIFGLPALWVFVAFGTALGIGVAIILHLTSSYRSERMKPLSILPANEKVSDSTVQEQDKRRTRLNALPRLCAPSFSVRPASGLAVGPKSVPI